MADGRYHIAIAFGFTGYIQKTNATFLNVNIYSMLVEKNGCLLENVQEHRVVVFFNDFESFISRTLCRAL